MALYVNTNVSSINAQRKLANSTLALNTSYQRLSSGLRINSSKDDAAGLQISDRLTAQINAVRRSEIWRPAASSFELLIRRPLESLW